VTTDSTVPVPVRDDLAPLDVVTAPTTQAIQRLELEAQAMKTAFQIANSLSKTTMVPAQYQQSYTGTRSQPHAPLGEVAAYNLAAAILYGAELGMSAVQAAQNVFVVNGKPAVYARTMAAQVRRAGYVIEEVEASDKKVVWKGLRDGAWALSEWTIERAQQAGYTTNKLYQSNPQEMLRAKCISEVCRIKFQDVLLGMAYSVEELQLIEGVSVQRVSRKGGSKGATALREIAQQEMAEAPQVDVEPEPAKGGQADPVMAAVNLAHEVAQDEQSSEPDLPPLSNVQATKIRSLYKAKGVTGQAVLDDIGAFLQRKVTSLHDISGDDAEAVIRSLQQPE
jgi:uncharacterized tellurite resistance protein B-like protein